MSSSVKNLERLELVRTEGIQQRDIGGVAAARDQNTPTRGLL